MKEASPSLFYLRYQAARDDYLDCKRQTEKVLAETIVSTHSESYKNLNSSFKEINRRLAQRTLRMRLVDLLPAKLSNSLRARMEMRIFYRELWDGLRLFYFRERTESNVDSKINYHLRSLMEELKPHIRVVRKVNNPVKYGLDLREYLKLMFKFVNLHGGVSVSEWIHSSLMEALDIIPESIIRKGGFSKVVRTLGGVLTYVLTDLKSDTSDEIAQARLEKAAKGGFYYGMLYPLVDDIIDEQYFKGKQLKQFIEAIDHWITGDFLSFPDLETNNSVAYLKNCFKEFHRLYPYQEHPEFYKESFILHFAQIEDSNKSFDKNYDANSIYVPVIIKAAYSRMVAASLAEIQRPPQFAEKMLLEGLMLQLIDDFRDFPQDVKRGIWTPFTYYYSQRENGLINPFKLFFSVQVMILERWNDDQGFSILLGYRFAQALGKYKTNQDAWPLERFLKHFSTQSPLDKEILNMNSLSKEEYSLGSRIANRLNELAILEHQG